MEKLRTTFAIEIAIKHFPLHPGTPDNGLTLEKLFAGRDIDLSAAQARMSRLMAVEGLPFAKRTMTYNSPTGPRAGEVGGNATLGRADPHCAISSVFRGQPEPG